MNGSERMRILKGIVAGGVLFLTSALATAGDAPAITTPAREVIQAGKTASFPVAVPKIEPGKDVLLSLRARLDSDHLAGGAAAMSIQINGKPVTGAMLAGRNAHLTFADGRDIAVVQGDAYFIYSSPDYAPIPRENPYCPIDVPNYDPYSFKFKVNGLVAEGTNTVTIRNVVPESAGHVSPLVIEEARISAAEAPAGTSPAVHAAAAAGPLPYIAPASVAPIGCSAEVMPGGALKITLGDAVYPITSEYSLMPGWAELKADKSSGFSRIEPQKDSLSAETETFSLSRKITCHAECVEIADTVTNKTGDNLPLMVRHSCRILDATDCRLGGRKAYLKRNLSSSPQNPSLVCMTPQGSFGLLPIDDVFRIHSLTSAYDGVYGLADNDLVLRPKSSYTLRFAVFPSRAKDYFGQINAMRRFLDVNFRIDGPGIWCSPREPGRIGPLNIEVTNRTSSIETLRNFITCKSTTYMISQRVEKYKDRELNGPDWLKFADAKKYRDFEAKCKEAAPGIRTSVYFATDFYTIEDGKTRYRGCEVLNPDGSQADYSDVNYPLWLSIDGNAYARDLEKTLDFILDDIGADGVFWDEFEMSAATWHYGEPWDGCSADIDPQTHKITRLKSSFTLITQPWREKMVNRIQAQGRYLIVNGSPMTDTMRKRRFMSLVETGGITNCTNAHLYTPIALGDQTTERSELDCYRAMLRVLNYGCVYYWYADWGPLPITHKTLTEYMFPITPVELGEGYILGKERILTAKSGWFSFGDASNAEAHFFGQDGIEVKRELPSEKKDGATWFKVELGENESCALVRSSG